MVKVRDGQVANRAIYAAIGVTLAGEEDILGLWAGTGGEGAKFWMGVLTDLRNRGVIDTQENVSRTGPPTWTAKLLARSVSRAPCVWGATSRAKGSLRRMSVPPLGLRSRPTAAGRQSGLTVCHCQRRSSGSTGTARGPFPHH